jgi:hypothetical protein
MDWSVCWGVHAHGGRRCHGLPAWPGSRASGPSSPSGKAPAVEVLSGASEFNIICMAKFS